ncbi:MAG TPA: hypothetical protein VK616_12485 [Flavitalea sp.]|nr:hypothetical protein [Flavitalea sp.]
MQSKITKERESSWDEIKGWGLGFAIEPTDHGTRYSHGGDNGGFQAGVMFIEGRKTGV